MASVSLADIGAAALMVRRDTKYLLPVASLASVLEQAAPHYRILEIDGHRLHRYVTRYFDTPELDLYRAHQRGVPRRFKVRSRKYVTTGSCFFEIKRRTARGFTEKSRQQADAFVSSVGPAERVLLRNEGLPVPGDFGAVLDNEFSRITLISRRGDERVTFDIDLRWHARPGESGLHRFAIVEVKRGGASAPSVVTDCLRAAGFRPRRFSKYCIGIAAVYKHVKRNNFAAEMRAAGLVDREREHAG